MSFNPAYAHTLILLPPQINLNSKELLNLIIKTRAELGELKGYSFSMPNPLLLLSPAIIKESLASSEIENINTTMIDVLENQLFPEIEQREPDKEVLRYRDAVLWGYENLQKYSLSTRLITGVQKKLLPESITGYRATQNGIANTITKEILYTPPLSSDISMLMGNLENFMNDNNASVIDPLIRSIISHYQFEAIHPFTDGNGRTGRILMVLQLINYGILNYPILYISGYINKNRNDYYRLLRTVTSEDKWYEYVLFMLEGFYLQAKATKSFFFEIMTLYFEYKKLIKEKHKKIYSGDLIETLFTFPVITAAKLSTELEIHRETAGKYLAILSKSGILVDRRMGRYHFYINKKLLDILHQ